LKYKIFFVLYKVQSSSFHIRHKITHSDYTALLHNLPATLLDWMKLDLMPSLRLEGAALCHNVAARVWRASYLLSTGALHAIEL
jgi:hypothetical protein